MVELLQSGNIVGFLGLALMIWAGLRLVRLGYRGGWFLAAGSTLVAGAIGYRSFVEPAIRDAVHLHFTHTQITLATFAPTMLWTLGFVLIPLGLLTVAASRQKEMRLVKVS